MDQHIQENAQDEGNDPLRGSLNSVSSFEPVSNFSQVYLTTARSISPVTCPSRLLPTV